MRVNFVDTYTVYRCQLKNNGWYIRLWVSSMTLLSAWIVIHPIFLGQLHLKSFMMLFWLDTIGRIPLFFHISVQHYALLFCLVMNVWSRQVAGRGDSDSVRDSLFNFLSTDVDIRPLVTFVGCQMAQFNLMQLGAQWYDNPYRRVRTDTEIYSLQGYISLWSIWLPLALVFLKYPSVLTDFPLYDIRYLYLVCNQNWLSTGLMMHLIFTNLLLPVTNFVHVRWFPFASMVRHWHSSFRDSMPFGVLITSVMWLSLVTFGLYRYTSFLNTLMTAVVALAKMDKEARVYSNVWSMATTLSKATASSSDVVLCSSVTFVVCCLLFCTRVNLWNMRKALFGWMQHGLSFSESVTRGGLLVIVFLFWYSLGNTMWSFSYCATSFSSLTPSDSWIHYQNCTLSWLQPSEDTGGEGEGGGGGEGETIQNHRIHEKISVSLVYVTLIPLLLWLLIVMRLHVFRAIHEIQEYRWNRIRDDLTMRLTKGCVTRSSQLWLQETFGDTGEAITTAAAVTLEMQERFVKDEYRKQDLVRAPTPLPMRQRLVYWSQIHAFLYWVYNVLTLFFVSNACLARLQAYRWLACVMGVITHSNLTVYMLFCLDIPSTPLEALTCHEKQYSVTSVTARLIAFIRLFALEIPHYRYLSLEFMMVHMFLILLKQNAGEVAHPRGPPLWHRQVGQACCLLYMGWAVYDLYAHSNMFYEMLI